MDLKTNCLSKLERSVDSDDEFCERLSAIAFFEYARFLNSILKCNSLSAELVSRLNCYELCSVGFPGWNNGLMIG